MAKPRFNYHKPKKRGFATLSRKHRLVLICKCEYGLTDVNTGRVLKMAQQTVKTHLMEIRRRTLTANTAQLCYEWRGWKDR